MSDTNVHRVVGNLLVGTGHLFVDTVNNQIGVNTSTPSAALDVASGDLKVGSDITIGNSGTITAANFSGNGSGLSGINSDSGSWVNGASSNVHLAVSTDNVGIATATPMTKLDIAYNAAAPAIVFSDTTNSRFQTGIGSLNVSNEGQRLDFYTGDSLTNGTLLTNTPRMCITGTGNVGVGTSSPGRLLEVYTGNGTVPGLRLRRGAGAAYTDLHHAAVNVPNTGDLEGLAIITSDGNQTTQEVMRICGNGRVGVGTSNPEGRLHLSTASGDAQSTDEALIIGGPTDCSGNTNLRLGCHNDYAWIQSHCNEPLCLNPDGNNVGISTNNPQCTLHVHGELRVPSLEAQLTLSGGGDVTWTGSYVKWDHRVIILPADNEYYNSNGHINIPCPTSGTIPFYNGSDTITTKTCTSSGIPLGAWEAVYYVISKGQGHGSSSHSTSINSNFIAVDYRSSYFKPQSNWILICLLNDDNKSLLWKPGQINITKGGVYSSSGGYVTKQNTYDTHSGTATGTGDWRSVTISESGIAHVHYHSLVRTHMLSGSPTTAVYAGLFRNSTNITDPVLGYRWATGSSRDEDRWRPINLSWSGKVAAGDVIKVVLSANENNGAIFNGESFSVLVV